MIESEAQMSGATVQVPKTLLTYFLGVLAGGLLGASITLTAAGIIRNGGGAIFIVFVLSVALSIASWAIGKPR